MQDRNKEIKLQDYDKNKVFINIDIKGYYKLNYQSIIIENTLLNHLKIIKKGINEKQKENWIGKKTLVNLDNHWWLVEQFWDQ